MKSLELFSGAGGMALGLKSSGFSHEKLIEWNSDACNTLRANLRHIEGLNSAKKVFEGDIRSFDFTQFEEKIDVVAGGPPCQPFSLGGKHQAFLDERDMFPEAIRSIREVRPKAFIFENVKGITRKAFATYLEYITLQLRYPDCLKKQNEEWLSHLSRLEKIHTRGRYSGLQYNLVYQVINAADFGVPQKRERIIFVGFRSDLGVEWSFPEKTHSEYALIYDQYFTSDYWDRHEISKANRILPSTGVINKAKFIEAALKTRPWKTVRDAISDLPDPLKKGNSWANKGHIFVAGAKKYPGHTGSFIDLPSKTIKAGDHGVPGGENMILFPNGNVRYFTIREAARIQTFPDSYDIQGSWTEAMRQIGNAVPVLLASIIGKSVKKAIDNVR